MFQLFFLENRLSAVPILHQSTHIAELLPQESPLVFLFDVIQPLSYLETHPKSQFHDCYGGSHVREHCRQDDLMIALVFLADFRTTFEPCLAASRNASMGST